VFRVSQLRLIEDFSNLQQRVWVRTDLTSLCVFADVRELLSDGFCYEISALLWDLGFVLIG